MQVVESRSKWSAERWSELTSTRWIEAASPQRVGVNVFHPQLHESIQGWADGARSAEPESGMVRILAMRS